ncbi:MAG: hypothetical protein IT293_15810 [Deltaproteobacteria bacterium]|nr:hypothetical protein [Deltaproteobacteria bacterium]
MRRREAGSAVVESLVALVLVALAGALVASAARSALRAAHRAATLARTTALAGRELARLAATAATAASDEATLDMAGFPGPVGRVRTVAHDGLVADLRIAVAAGRPPERVALGTRRLLPPPVGE